MANVYVYSGAAGAGTGADWTNAYTTLAAALTAKAAGDDFWVAHDHAETQASAMTLTSPGTAASPCRIICASRSGSTPPVSADMAATATVTTTTGGSTMSFAGVAYCRGVTFSAGTGPSFALLNIASSSGAVWKLDRVKLILGNTSVTSRINVGSNSAAQHVEWQNTTVKFGATAQGIALLGARFIWRDTAAAIDTGGSLPTSLFNSGLRAFCVVEGVDLSALGSGNSIVAAQNSPMLFAIKDCKLGASVTVAATPSNGVGDNEVELIRCDSGDTNYRTEKYRYEGTQTTETTIVRTGGASDGTTPIAWKIVTTANSKRAFPFEAIPISIWNETTGSAITLTIQGIWGGGAVPTNADIWMDVEYLGTSGVPLGSFASSGPADQLASGTNLAAGSGTWGGSTTKFTLTKQITPQEKGPITVYIKAALASSTFYIDPKITVT